MKRLATLAAAMGFAMAAGASHATVAPTFTTLDNPGDPTFNQLLGIDNAGTISGYFGSGAAGHPNQAYAIAAPYTSYTTIAPPGSVQAQATGIDTNGVISGFWSDTNTGSDANYGFIARPTHNGQYRYRTVNNPAVGSTPPVNQLLGVNTHNIAGGFYNDAGGNAHGYIAFLGAHTFRDVGVARATATAVTGINNSNVVCGFFMGGLGNTHAFIKNLNGGEATRFFVPGAPVTQFLGLNNNGIAAGFYSDSTGLTHGLLYNSANGAWQTVDAPDGVQGTTLNGLNDEGQAVGFYTDAAGNVHGLLVGGIAAPI